MSRVGELFADTHGGTTNFDLSLRRRRGWKVRRRHDEDSTKFVQGVSQLPSESKLRREGKAKELVVRD